jgi:hypothetical protein|mmetsp:Transcript_8268/g.15980  ORF Transcript_8268/g.15980 Transcript_8268/m.15980 type:complete len:100 (+) Transcript_8268:761-1060(+)
MRSLFPGGGWRNEGTGEGHTALHTAAAQRVVGAGKAEGRKERRQRVAVNGGLRDALQNQSWPSGKTKEGSYRQQKRRFTGTLSASWSRHGQDAKPQKKH